MMRAFFVVMPAIFWGGLAALLHPFLGLLIFLCVAGLGVQLTEARWERGDRPYER